MNQQTDKTRINADADISLARLNPNAMENLRALEKLGVEGAFRELAEMFLQDMPDKIEMLRELAASQDLKRLARSAHDLKNVSATLGADLLSEMSHLLELQAKSGNLNALSELIDSAEMEYSRVEAALLQELTK